MFFSPENDNCIYRRNYRNRKQPNKQPQQATVVQEVRRSLIDSDWTAILEASKSRKTDEYVVRDLERLCEIAPEGVVSIPLLFPDITSLNGGGSKHYAMPMKVRLNNFFGLHQLPYKVLVSEKGKGSDNWFLRVVPTTTLHL